jgi:hypothetical protein
MPSAVQWRPDWTSVVISRKISRSAAFGPRSGKRSKNGEDPRFELARLRDLEVPDTVAPSPCRPHAEDRPQKRWRFWADLRHVERQRDPPRQTSITLATDWDVEASLTIDEPRHVVTYVGRDCIQPVRGTGPFLLIVRTGRFVTAHDHTVRRRCDSERVPPDTRSFQHIAELLSGELLRRGRNG